MADQSTRNGRTQSQLGSGFCLCNAARRFNGWPPSGASLFLHQRRGVGVSRSRFEAPHEEVGGAFSYALPKTDGADLFACLIAYVLYAADAWNNVEAGLASQSSWLRKFYLFEPDFGSFVRFVFWDVYFGYDEKTSWNSALWTMPTELMCSFALFAILMVLRWRALRIAICAALAIYSVNSFSFGFFSGMLVAELIVAVNTSQGMRNHAVALSRVGLLLSVGAVVVAIWARSGFPQSGQFNTTLGKNMISLAMVLGGFMCVPVRNWLQSPISRQMGRSSFALYLVHMPIICSVSSGLYLACVGVLPFYALVFLVTAFTIVTSLVVAHAFTLVVEEKLLGSLKGFIALRVTRFAEADWTLRGLAYWRMVRRQLLPDLSGMRLRPTSMGAQQTGMEKFSQAKMLMLSAPSRLRGDQRVRRG